MKNKYNIDDMLQSIDLLETEVNSVSDRSCAIVCAAFLDDFLGKLLMSFLTEESPTQDKRLFDNNGPLSTFSSKIVLSYRLGLISKKEFDNLNLIRKVRNAFAHDVKINSFDNGEIKSLLQEHIPDENLLPPTIIPITLDDMGKPLDIPLEIFMQFVSDEKEYSKIVENFPPIKFRELDKNNTRSIFLAIVHILHASLNSRLLFALINQRKSLDEFKDIVEIERFKTEILNKSHIEEMAKLRELKLYAENQITVIEKKLSSNNPEAGSLNEIKNKLEENLFEINKLISEIKNPTSIEHAFQIHTYWLLKYQFSRRNTSEN